VHTAPAVPPERKPLAILSVLAVLALLWATMWPFNPHPRNDVSWLPDANGLRFDGSGIVFSDGALRPVTGVDAGDACAIELYLRPRALKESGNFLTLSSDDNPDAILLSQWRESLLIYRSTPARWHAPRLALLGVNHVLHPGQLVLATISSGSDGTTVYIDGKFSKRDPHFRIRRNELYRQIVLGNSPSNFKVWKGEIHGLAVYDEKVSPAEAAAHFAEWSGTSRVPSGEDRSHLLALYDFHERSGNAIHNEVAPAPALTIPPHFSIPRKSQLASVGHQFEWTASYRYDVITNIVGFLPLGFVLCGFFSLSRSRVQAVLISALCGAFLSFSIEFLQYYIPRRDSGWTDVVTNTTGTLLGALIAHPELVRTALRLVNLIPPKRNSEANQS
jgi:hypothetical protein